MVSGSNEKLLLFLSPPTLMDDKFRHHRHQPRGQQNHRRRRLQRVAGIPPSFFRLGRLFFFFGNTQSCKKLPLIFLPKGVTYDSKVGTRRFPAYKFKHGLNEVGRRRLLAVFQHAHETRPQVVHVAGEVDGK